MNFDEKVRFVDEVSVLDDDTSASIQPVSNNERLVDTVLGRPDENLRLRTEVLRKAIEDLKYRSDYTALILQSAGRFRLNAVSATTWTIETDASEGAPNLSLTPALTPGAVSGGRVDPTIGLSGARLTDPTTPNKYYLGVLGTNDLWLFASTEHTGQRAYADGVDMGDLDVVSIGSNNISIDIRVDADLSAHEIEIDAVTGNPRRHIKIRYGDGTTIGELRDYINNDRIGVAPVGGPSQDGQTWGIGNMIRAGTTATTSNVLTGVNLLDTEGIPIQFQGGADAETFVVTTFATFFATSANQMQQGESIALAFTSGSTDDAPAYGGRRQSIIDRASDRVGTPAAYTPSDSLLFNTGRFPERIPGAIPIGKCYENMFVFIDGTVLSCAAWSGTTTNGPWVRIGQNAPFILALAASTGATLMGTAATGVWNTTSPLTAQPVALRSVPAGTVQSSLNAIVSQLGKIDSASSPHDSGARRIGVEEIAASPTTPNEGLEPSEGSLYEVLAEFLNDSLYGLNARVGQWGHHLRGPVGISKNYVSEAVLGGGDHAIGIYGTMGSIATTDMLTVENRNLFTAHPVQWSTAPTTDALLLEEPVSGTVINAWTLQLSGTDIAARIANFAAKLPIGTVTTPVGGTTVPVANIIVSLRGFVPGAGKTDTNGEYYLTAYDVGDASISLARMDALAFLDPGGATASVHPDFDTGTFTSATVTINSTLIVGTDLWGQKIRSFHAGPNPFMNVTMQKITTPIIESCVASSAVSPPPRVMQLTPGALKFKDVSTDANSVLTENELTFYDAGGTVLRTSNNILTSADKALLDGLETAAPADATANHHHASAYSARYHDHVIGSDSTAMTAYDPNDGTSLGSSPALSTIYAVPNTTPGFEHRAVFRLPAGTSYWTDVNGVSIVQCEVTVSLRSAVNAGSSDVLYVNAIYAIQAGYQLLPTWGASLNSTGTLLNYEESSFQYIPTTKYVLSRAKETFTIQMPTLPALADPADYYPVIWVTIDSSSSDTDMSNSTLRMRHLLTASYTI